MNQIDNYGAVVDEEDDAEGYLCLAHCKNDKSSCLYDV
jgi:hypothetical protein